MRRVLAIVLAGCSSSPQLSTCADSLAGTWRAESGDWMLVDRGRTLEGYPLFDDSHEIADRVLVVAPRVIDLRRDGDAVTGEISRRYMTGGDACVTTVPFRVLSCSGHTIEVILADSSPPTRFAPCAESSRTNPSRREKWRRTHP